jgi:mRNA-degrading endonuclease RelE of RelBE toxin-antitoxin system
MNSKTLPSFWKAYKTLDQEIHQQAKKAYFLWINNPAHPSLRFKCINHKENLWSVRITRSYRAIGILDGFPRLALDRQP